MLLPLGFSLGQTTYWHPKKSVRFWDLHVNPLEFRTPLQFMPFDVKAGIVPYGGPDMFQPFPFGLFQSDDSAVLLDSTESEMGTIQSLSSRLILVYDLEFLKFNPLASFLPASLLDLMIGVGIRTNQNLGSPPLPSNWPQGTDEYDFSPIFQQALLNVTASYQRSEKWYAYFQATQGLARGSLYRATALDRYLHGTGTSADYTLGIKFFRSGSGNARYCLGGELRHHSLNIPQVDDSDKLSPIEGVQLRYLGLFFTFGVAFGGEATAADKAKRDLYRGDYMSAEANLQTFLDTYPDHRKKRRAKRLLAVAEEYVPYQQVDIARSAQADRSLETALIWLDRADTRADSALRIVIDQVRAEVGYTYLQDADSILRRGDLTRTERLLGHARLLMPPGEDLVDQYDAEVLIQRGHALRQSGALVAALRKYDLAIESDTSRRIEIEGYKVRIAEDLLAEAEYAANRSAIALALESLRLTQTLDPRRKAELDALIRELDARLERIARGEVRRRMEEQLQEARELRQKIPPSKPRIGLLVAQLEDVLDKPDYVTQTTDRFGVNHQLWEYQGGEYPGLYYFENYILTRIESLPGR
jgi:hypothetical protein